MTPIHHLKHLQFLDLSDNQISDLSPLSHLEFLQGLNVMNNQVSDLTPITKLPLLKALLAQGNRIASISGLQQLTIVKLDQQHLQWEIEGKNPCQLDLTNRLMDETGEVPMIMISPSMGSYNQKTKIISLHEGITQLTFKFDSQEGNISFNGVIDCLVKPKLKE